MERQTVVSRDQRSRKFAVLIALALLALALGLYQWIELIQIRTGGPAPLCSLSETINCAAVWNSPLAKTIHDVTGIPFAGWGVAWSLIVLLIGIELIILERKGTPLDDGAVGLAAYRRRRSDHLSNPVGIQLRNQSALPDMLPLLHTGHCSRRHRLQPD